MRGIMICKEVGITLVWGDTPCYSPTKADNVWYGVVDASPYLPWDWMGHKMNCNYEMLTSCLVGAIIKLAGNPPKISTPRHGWWDKPWLGHLVAKAHGVVLVMYHADMGWPSIGKSWCYRFWCYCNSWSLPLIFYLSSTYHPLWSLATSWWPLRTLLFNHLVITWLPLLDKMSKLFLWKISSRYITRM